MTGDFIFGVFIVVLTGFGSFVFTYSYSDVDASRYHEAAAICDKVNSELVSFDVYSVKCENGAMFKIEEESAK